MIYLIGGIIVLTMFLVIFPAKLSGDISQDEYKEELKSWEENIDDK